MKTLWLKYIRVGDSGAYRAEYFEQRLKELIPITRWQAQAMVASGEGYLRRGRLSPPKVSEEERARRWTTLNHETPAIL